MQKLLGSGSSGTALRPPQSCEQLPHQQCAGSGDGSGGGLSPEQQAHREQRQQEHEVARAAALAQTRRHQEEHHQQQRQLHMRQAGKSGGGKALRGPRGPCGEPCNIPPGGITRALPLASALHKGQPPWYARGADLSRVTLLPDQDVLRVFYPAGSSTPSSGLRGGVQLRGEPCCLPARDVILRFSFATADNFDWTRGGKLGGGLHIGRGDASGYRHSDWAASARVVWGREGAIMLYVYTMNGTVQDPSYAEVAKTGHGCGDHLFPNTFQVQKASWHNVTIRVRLNTPGLADGVAGLGVDGAYREFDKMMWRTDHKTHITQVLISTFFGGSWSTPVDTSVDFSNFSVTILE